MTLKIFGVEIALCSILVLAAISAADDQCLYECKDLTGTEMCITVELLCNHFPDCENGEDEANCGCEGFTCVNNGICIESSRECNGYEDCFDKSDEANCTKARYKERFPWSSEKDLCIKPCGRNGNCSFATDGQAICLCNDGYSGTFCNTQDLVATTHSTTLQEQKLPEDKFACGSQEISRKLFCDGTVDCNDESDETNCTFDDYKKAKPHLSPRFLCLMPCKRTACAFDHALKAHCPCPEKSEGVFCENLIRNTTTSTTPSTTPSTIPATSAQEEPTKGAEINPEQSNSVLISVLLPAIGVAGLALALWLWRTKPWAAAGTLNRPLV